VLALFATIIGVFVLLGVPTATAQSTVNVGISSYAFSSSTVTVVIGVNNTVTWTNHDPVAHTVTADGGSFDSGTISSGGTFSHTFTAAGAYSYHCSIHTYMKGTVIVLSGASSSTTTSAPSTTSSSSGYGGVPEFPFQAVTIVVVVALVAVSYLAVRRSQKR
jgi:plastocyanin